MASSISVFYDGALQGSGDLGPLLGFGEERHPATDRRRDRPGLALSPALELQHVEVEVVREDDALVRRHHGEAVVEVTRSAKTILVYPPDGDHRS
jgi:hypothetical protein